MTFVADEGVDKPIVDALRNAGYKVLYIAETNPSVPDNEVLEIANSHQAVLITMDKDFGELVIRKKQIASGVVLLRLLGLSREHKINAVLQAVSKHGDELHNSFTVITDKQVRIRTLN